MKLDPTWIHSPDRCNIHRNDKLLEVQVVSMTSMTYQFHHDPSILSCSNRPGASLAFGCPFLPDFCGQRNFFVKLDTTYIPPSTSRMRRGSTQFIVRSNVSCCQPRTQLLFHVLTILLLLIIFNRHFLSQHG